MAKSKISPEEAKAAIDAQLRSIAISASEEDIEMSILDRQARKAVTNVFLDGHVRLQNYLLASATNKMQMADKFVTTLNKIHDRLFSDEIINSVSDVSKLLEMFESVFDRLLSLSSSIDTHRNELKTMLEEGLLTSPTVTDGDIEKDPTITDSTINNISRKKIQMAYKVIIETLMKHGEDSSFVKDMELHNQMSNTKKANASVVDVEDTSDVR